MSFRWILLVAVALSCSAVSTVNGLIEDYEQKWLETMNSMTSPPSGNFSVQALSCKGIQFDTPDGTCKLDPKPEATSVHLLTPADISIVAAIGDSITAGFGATSSSIFDSPTREARGVSWCIGGDGQSYVECTTIPNILKTFNHDVYGASTGSGNPDSSGSRLNRAVSGAESTDIYSQAEKLVEMIEALSEEEQSRWKLVTLWIGGNDLCKHCSTSEGDTYSAANYVQRIKDTLLFLKGRLTKTLVNVPQALDVTKIAKTTGLICGIVHWFACDCASKSVTADRAKEYQEALDMLDGLAELEDDDFAVVVQPFFKKVDLPLDGDGKPDMSFFAPDCFHMSVKGHRAIAAALWNNMVSEKSDKEIGWDPYNPVLHCPDPARPYFYTSHTQSLLEAESEGGGFNAQSLPNPEEESHDDGWSISQIFGVAIGTAAAAYMVAVVVGVAIGGAVWVRRRRPATPNTEALPLVKRL